MKSYKIVGVGVGPFNLSTAALSHERGVESLFLEAKEQFDWHPGMLIAGAKMQVPFLADLVSLANPASRYSFLSYLHAKGRLFSFYFKEDIYPERREYVNYCQWVASRLENIKFGARVSEVSPDPQGGFRVRYTLSGAEQIIHAENIVLGVGTEPVIPDSLQPVRASASGTADTNAPLVCHSADYLAQRAVLDRAERVCVIGSGQSGAEVFLDQLRRREPGEERLTWVTRSRAIAPMEHSKLGLEHFTPEYMSYFQALPSAARHQLFADQWQLYKAVSDETIGDIFDELYARSINQRPRIGIHPAVTVLGFRFSGDCLELELQSNYQSSRRARILADAVVCATGYMPRDCGKLLVGISIVRDEYGSPIVDDHHRLRINGAATGRIYVQNMEHVTHGVGTPDLGLTAWRSQRILNEVTGKDVSAEGNRLVFTDFELP